MPNRNYIKGRLKEYKFVHEAKARGCIAFRSAGSHSPIDVVVINKEQKIIELIQCKPDNFSKLNTGRLIEEHKGLNGKFTVLFRVE